MRVIKGDLFDEIGKANLLLVTCNNTVKKNGELVMGRGAARDLAERYPWIPAQAGEEVRTSLWLPGLGWRYGVKVMKKRLRKTRFGIFQVKYHFAQLADLRLILYSTRILRKVALDYKRIVMNFPGVGYGRLRFEDVLPILVALPENVFLYVR